MAYLITNAMHYTVGLLFAEISTTCLGSYLEHENRVSLGHTSHLTAWPLVQQPDTALHKRYARRRRGRFCRFMYLYTYQSKCETGTAANASSLSDKFACVNYDHTVAVK